MHHISTFKVKTSVFFVILLALFSSCENTILEDEINIKYKNFDIYLKTSKNSDAPSPPIFNLNFSCKNLTAEEKFFAVKSSSYDDDKSIMYLLDTLQNKIIPLYSGSINSIKPKDSIKITAKIDVRDYKDYFGLPGSYFLGRFDFEDDKENLKKLCSDMIDRSIIIYISDSTDLGAYRLENKNITSLRYNSIIKITK